MSLYSEDFPIGQTYETRGCTITETDLVLFSGLSRDVNALYTDAVFAAASEYGQPVMHGMLGVSVVTGLVGGSGLFDRTAPWPCSRSRTGASSPQSPSATR